MQKVNLGQGGFFSPPGAGCSKVALRGHLLHPLLHHVIHPLTEPEDVLESGAEVDDEDDPEGPGERGDNRGAGGDFTGHDGLDGGGLLRRGRLGVVEDADLAAAHGLQAGEAGLLQVVREALLVIQLGVEAGVGSLGELPGGANGRGQRS